LSGGAQQYATAHLSAWGFVVVLNELRKMFNAPPSQAEDLIVGEVLPYYLIEKHSINVGIIDGKEKQPRT